MRSDLDQLMRQRGIDSLIIPGNEVNAPQRNYLTGGVKAHAMVIKKVGEAPIIIANPMEVDEAAKSGLQVMTTDDFDLTQLSREHGRGTAKTRELFYGRIFERLGIQGRLTLYGVQDIQDTLALSRMLRDAFAGQISLVEDENPDIFTVAAETKDADELEKLRDAGERASAAMRDTRTWLASHRVQDGQVVGQDGQPLTIGDVKRYVRLKLLEYDMEDVDGSMIFAQGRDAGVPHSRGEADEVLRPGESIVFDLFPRRIGGGYFHDMTRTWCLGYAPEHVQKDFDLVLNILHRSLEEINPGEATRNVDAAVCQWFEAAGHPTRMSSPNTSEGYVHSLGHGIGLNVHEAPGISHLGSENQVFRPGHVVTIEPGLYYPSKGYGIRVEDTVYLDESGQLVNLTDCPYELVIPLSEN